MAGGLDFGVDCTGATRGREAGAAVAREDTGAVRDDVGGLVDFIFSLGALAVFGEEE